MTSKENVMRAIEFKTPEWLPIDCPEKDYNDFNYVALNIQSHGDESKQQSYDEWGCLWVRSDVHNFGQCKVHPLEDLEKLDTYIWPDPERADIFDGVDEKLAGNDDKYSYFGVAFLLFERIQSLRGFENALIDIISGEDQIEWIADKITEYSIRVIENTVKKFPGKFSAFCSSDDWGTEISAFISPDLWNSFFKPRYTRIADACHKAGLHFILHSCGKVNELIPGMIDAGIDVLNLQQPTVLGIEEIGTRFAGKICFSTINDIQKTLPFKDEQYIIEEAKSIIEHWSTPKGGLILTDYGDFEAFGAESYKKEFMLEAFRRFDPWIKK